MDEFKSISAQRRVSVVSIATAGKLGLLHVATVKGFLSWILTDERRVCAEARRIDGKLYPATTTLKARKVHTLQGSSKNWAVGLCPARCSLNDFRAVMLVEGGPDLLAGLHFTLRHHGDCLPVALLGAGVKTIHTDALKLLRGKRIRIYPHFEANNAGRNASERWAEQLIQVGCEVDCYSFEGLQREDGQPVKDLNDATRIHPDQVSKLDALLP